MGTTTHPYLRYAVAVLGCAAPVFHVPVTDFSVMFVKLFVKPHTEQIRELIQGTICSEGRSAFKPLCDRGNTCTSTAEGPVQHWRGGNEKLLNQDCQVKERDCKDYSPEYACKTSVRLMSL